MTQPSTKSVLDNMLAAANTAHSHLLRPINSHALRRERASAIESLEGLMAYQRFIADAQAVKAERRRVSKAFENHVRAQSRQALTDVNSFMRCALRTTVQINQADFWQEQLRQAAAALEQTGPVTAQDLWNDIRGRPGVMSTLSRFGFSDSLAAMSDNVFAASDAVLRKANGRVEVVSRRPGAEDHSITLIPSRARPTTVVELLSRPSFDQLAATFLQSDDDSYLAAVSHSSSSCEPSELVAFAAFASRQHFVEEVRKLEDRGLAAVAGGLPVLPIVLLVIGVAFYLVGLWIADACNDPLNIDPPSQEACTAGVILTWLGIAAIAVAAGWLAMVAIPALAGVSPLALTTGELALVLGFGLLTTGIVFLVLYTQASFLDATGGGFEVPQYPDELT